MEDAAAVVSGEVVEASEPGAPGNDEERYEVGQEIERAPQHQEPAPLNLFRTDDPVEVVEAAGKVADALKGVLDKQGLTSNISGRAHVRVEGWQTVGTMLGIVPVIVETSPVAGEAHGKGEHGWDAICEARTLDGRVVGRAEARCSRAEGTWRNRDDYALKSMAQTRAMSKALKSVLGFVVTLAGYESTPAEEMDNRDTLKFGEHAEAADAEKLGRAIGYLADNDAKLAAAIWRSIEQDAGYMPRVVARALLRTAQLVRDHRLANDPEYVRMEAGEDPTPEQEEIQDGDADTPE